MEGTETRTPESHVVELNETCYYGMAPGYEAEIQLDEGTLYVMSPIEVGERKDNGNEEVYVGYHSTNSGPAFVFNPKEG